MMEKNMYQPMLYKYPQNNQCGYILQQSLPQLWIEKIPFKSEINDSKSEVEFKESKLSEAFRTCVGLMNIVPSAVKIRSSMVSHSTPRESLEKRKKYSSNFITVETYQKGIIKKQKYSKHRSILVAKPNHVCFHNFEKNRLYQKVVTLTNISNISTRFRIDPKSNHANFIVVIKDDNRDTNLIAAGVQIKLVVLFYTEDICEKEDFVTIYVQHGKSIGIKLQCTRDPPILKRLNGSYLQCLVSQMHTLSVTKSITISSDSWESYTTEYPDTDTESDNYYSENSAMHSTNSNMIIECGKCFVGEQVALQIKFKNSGGKGKFFLISETDWHSMSIEDITNTNILALESFAIWPAYFVLKPEEEIFIHAYFFPDSYGLHVDILYIISDNNSFQTTELIGDGMMYEPQIFHINCPDKTFLFMKNIDEEVVAHYYLNVQLDASDGVIRNKISITNTSPMYMFFRWEKCCVQIGTKNDIIDSEHFMNYLQIQPENGIFPPSTVVQFNIIITIPQIRLNDNQTYGFIRLYIEDIPQAAIPTKYKLKTTESKTKRRVCFDSVDILVTDIKLIHYSQFDKEVEDKSWTVDEYINVIDEEDLLDFAETQFSMREQWSIDTDTVRSVNIDEKQVSLPLLMLEELHSTIDIIDIKSMKSCLFESVVGIGILRPLKLFLGFKKILSVRIKNTLPIPISYKWGNPEGLDSSKLKIIFCPESGCIPGECIANVQILCCPIQAGYVKSLYIPCYVGHSLKIIFLQVECDIKSLYVTFHIPYSKDKCSKVYKNSISIEWNSSSVSIRPDLLRIQKLMLNKTTFGKLESCMKLNEDVVSQNVFIECFELDQDTSIEENSTSDNTENEQLDSPNSEDLISEIEDKQAKLINFAPFNQLLPVDQIKLAEEPVIMEFIEVPLGIVTKKTFLIRNETPIASSFWLRLNNFYPVYIAKKGKIKEGMLKSIYKKIVGYQTEDIWKELKQPHSGILIYVNPLITQLGPYEDALVDIYVFVDTWGIYLDELEIHISGLPQYTLAICVHVTEMPISFPICEKTQLKIPICRFGTLSASSSKETRMVLLKNRCSIPLMINWHVVSTQSSSENNDPPFNVILHMRTPFTNKLAIALREIQKNHETEKLHRYRLEIREFQEDSQQLSDHTFETFSYDYMETYSLSEHASYCYTNESKTTGFQMDLIPYNLMGTKICTITPAETFISPKGKAYIKVEVFPDKCFLDKDISKILCNALGFIQIAPMDKYKDKHYCRYESLLTPMQIQIEAEIVKLRLFYDIPKSDRLFIFCTDDVMNSPHHTMKIRRAYTLHNKGENVIHVKFDINGPFMIEYITIEGKTRIDNFSEGVYIEKWNSIKVHVACVVDAKFIQEIMETNNNIKVQHELDCSKQNNNWCDKGLLLIIYTDYTFETLELFLKIHLPSLNLSSYSLNFGNVCIGDTKKCLLDIENLSAYKCKFEIDKTLSNEDFTYTPVTGEILARPVNGKRFLTITICFSPRNIGPSKEILKIMSTIPNYVEQCVLCGNGTLEKKIYQDEMEDQNTISTP